MKFAICNEMFEGWDFAGVCRTAAEFGYDGVEVTPYTLGDRPRDLPAAERARMVKEAAAAGVEIVGLHWLLAKTQGFHVSHPDAAVRKRTADYLVDLVRLCSDLGGRVMVFGSPNQRSILDGVTPDQAWGYTADTLRAVIPALEQLGITLCIEPLSHAETNFLNTAAEACRMICELDSPRIGLILDVKAMSSEASTPADIIRANRDSLAHVHANDANRRGPGFGNTDFIPIAQALHDIDYGGWVSVEVFDFTPDPVTIARDSMKYLTETFGGASK